MENYWAWTTYIYMLTDILGTGYALYRFTVPFLVRKRGAFCIGAAYSATICALHFLPCPIHNFVIYSAGVLVSLSVMCRVDPRNYCQKIFIAVTFFSLRWMSAYMTMSVMDCIYEDVVSRAYLIRHPVLQLAAYIGTELLNLTLRFLILGVGIKCIVKAYAYKREYMSAKELFMLLVPSATGMLEYEIMRYYQTVLENSTGNGTVNAGSSAALHIYDVLAFFHYGISIAALVVMTVIFQNVKARQEEKLQRELLDAQLQSIRRHIGQVEDSYQNIRGIRHDMTNHMLTLEKLYACRKPEDALAYSADLKKALGDLTGEEKSGSPVTDVILREWQREAEKRNICFRSDFHYPADSGINAFDVSVILNNALQNAVEHTTLDAADGVPYISIVSYCRNNAFMIEISNRFNGELQWDDQSGLPVTSKGKADDVSFGEAARYERSHGYGIANIQRMARKYCGDIDIVLKEGEFCLCVLMMTESGN